MILNREYGNLFQYASESIVVADNRMVPVAHNITDSADFPE